MSDDFRDWYKDQKEFQKKVAEEELGIVRCKDCKYKVETEDGEWNPEDIVCDYWASDGLEADDFCSRGEKKDEID